MRVIPVPAWLDEPLKAVGVTLEGLPSVKSETWNITDFRKLPDNLPAYNQQEEKDYPLWNKGGSAVDLSNPVKLPENVSLIEIDSTVWEKPFLPNNPFPEVNAGLCPIEQVLTLEKDLEQSLEVLLGTLKPEKEQSVVHRRLTVIVKEGVTASLALTLGTVFDGFSTQNLRFIIEKNANFTLIFHQNGSKNRQTVTNFEAIIGEKSHFDARFLEEGGAFSRVHYDIRGEGKHSNAILKVISLISPQHQADHVATVDHKQYGIASQQVFKALVAPHGTHQVISKTAVQKEGQKTDAHQKLAAVLLGDYASHFARPELEIWADDVKCSHGSTVGQLDETALYYLRSRGLPLIEAQALLMEAFVFEELDNLPEALDSYRNILENHMKQWMRSQTL